MEIAASMTKSRMLWGVFAITLNSLGILAADIPEPPVFEMRLVQESSGPDYEQMNAPRMTRAGELVHDVVYVHRDLLIDESAIASAFLGRDPFNGRARINIRFTDAGRDLLAEVTRDNIGNQLAVLVGGNLLTVPRVGAEIVDGRVLVSGVFSDEEAKEYADLINNAVGASAADREPDPPLQGSIEPLPGEFQPVEVKDSVTGISFEVIGRYAVLSREGENIHSFIKDGSAAAGFVATMKVPRGGYDMERDPIFFKLENLKFSSPQTFQAGERELNLRYFTFDTERPTHMRGVPPTSGGMVVWGIVNGHLYQVVARDTSTHTLQGHSELSGILETIRIEEIEISTELYEPGGVVDLADRDVFSELIGKTVVVNHDGLVIKKYRKARYTDYYPFVLALPDRQKGSMEDVDRIPAGAKFKVESVISKIREAQRESAAKIITEYISSSGDLYLLEIPYALLERPVDHLNPSLGFWLSVKKD